MAKFPPKYLLDLQQVKVVRIDLAWIELMVFSLYFHKIFQ